MQSARCNTCGGELIQNSRLRLFVVGLILIGVVGLAPFVPYLWAAALISALAGAYLVVWATLGQGRWCRACKKFAITRPVPN
jgi:hypothetical protein